MEPFGILSSVLNEVTYAPIPTGRSDFPKMTRENYADDALKSDELV